MAYICQYDSTGNLQCQDSDEHFTQEDFQNDVDEIHNNLAIMQETDPLTYAKLRSAFYALEEGFTQENFGFFGRMGSGAGSAWRKVANALG